jgi:hypothetical protein
MVVATHGRALWVLDNLAPVQEMAAAQKALTDATLFSPAPQALYRRPSRDRNYEFWGDEVFFGENPPAAAVISWYLKKDVSDVALRITDATGTLVREISGDVLENSTKAGIQAACWDLRVQPVPNVDTGRGGRGNQGRQGGTGGQQQQEQEQRATQRFGAGCTGGGGGGGFGGGGGGNAGPWVLPGTYTVALMVDGKTAGTKPLRVAADPEVVLTQAERKKLYDMAMEIHALQLRANDSIEPLAQVRTQMPEVMKQVAAKTDLPAEVKTQAESFDKELTALMTKLVPQGGGRGGRGGGNAEPSPMARAAQAKNGLMGGMWPTRATTDAYTEAKAGIPGAITEANAAVAKAQTLSASLAKHGITLNVPAAKTTTKPNSQ